MSKEINENIKTRPTLKQKINEVVEKFKNEDELKKAIFDLIQRVQYPDQFCPECDDRLFLDENKYRCLNCGFTTDYIQPTSNISQKNSNNKIVSNGKIPDQVEKVIKEAEENTKDKKIAVPTGRGEQIRRLAEGLNNPTPPATSVDTTRLQNSDPNIRDVNWI